MAEADCVDVRPESISAPASSRPARSTRHPPQGNAAVGHAHSCRTSSQRPALDACWSGRCAPGRAGAPPGLVPPLEPARPGWRSPGGRPAASGRRRRPRAARRVRWRRRPGPGRRPSGTSGSSDAVDHQERPPLEERGVLGRVQDRQLLGPGVRPRPGSPACEITPVRRQRSSRCLGIPGERAQIGRRAQAGHARHPLVAGRQVERQHPAEPEADRPDAGASSGTSVSARNRRSSSQPRAEKSPADSPAPRRAAVTTRQPDSRVRRSASAG